MELGLNAKVALVTGSTAGIGLAIAQALAAEGADVIVNGRTQRRVDDAVRAVRESTKSGTVRGIAADLGTRDGADQLIAKLPSVDVLVNNLGIFEAKPFAEITDGEWMRMFEINVLSGVRLARHYLPRMLSAGGRKRVLHPHAADVTAQPLRRPGGDRGGRRVSG
jgi:NAD(P)-dependent dehydrogenase (short-subunit alcohol dehydrogenase family)